MLNCVPLARSDLGGKIEIDYDIFPLNEDYVWTDEVGNELGIVNIQDNINLVFIREGYRSQTKSVKIDTLKPLELIIVLEGEY